MNTFLLKMALNLLFGAYAKEFVDLAQRLILAAEQSGGTGEDKARSVLEALSKWAQEKGVLVNFPPALREAIFRLAIEVFVFILSRQGLINAHKQAYYQQETFA